MKVKIKKLDESATLPKYAKEGDAGLDLIATNITPDRNFIEYGTSLSIEIPKGYLGMIFPRSSLSNKGLMLKNSVGIIDSSYRGELKLRFYDLLSGDAYRRGDKIGQLIILPYPQIELEEVGELSETERGQGGFGSTDI